MLTATRSPGEARAIDLVGPDSALVRELTAAYWHELMSVTNHLASATNRDGVHAERIGGSIHEVITADLRHAQQVAVRIGQLRGAPPNPGEFAAQKLHLRPPVDPLDHGSALTGLIDAETAALERYSRIADLAMEAYDWVTRRLASQILSEKENHRDSLGTVLATAP
jgi:bacterioferritin (cytochrome b1)